MSVTPLHLDFQIQPQGKGLLWALWQIHSAKGTGVLTVEWERFTKQIVFRLGEPVGSRSNWPQESLAHYLMKSGRLDPQVIRQELLSLQADPQKRSLAEWLVSQQLVSPGDMSDVLSDHFRQRVFGLVGLSHGRLVFKAKAQLDDHETQPSQLQAPFLKLLWDAVKLHFEPGVCRAKLSQRLTQRLKVEGAFPLPLVPQELRVWNSVAAEPQIVSSADPLVLKLLAVAAEFDQVSVVDEAVSELHHQLKIFEHQSRSKKFHEILGVNLEQISSESIKKVYLDMIKRYHPDRLPANVPQEVKSLAEQVFARVNEAYSTLSNPNRLADYIAQLKIDAMGGREKLESQIQAERLVSQAKVTLKGKHFRQAYELFLKIEQILPEDVEVKADRVYSEMMAMVSEKKSVKDALPSFIKQLEECVKSKASYAHAHYYLGLSYKMLGRGDRALVAFDKAYSIDSNLLEASSESRILRMKLDSSKKSSGKA